MPNKPPVYVPTSLPEDVRNKAREMLDVIVKDLKISTFLERASWNHTVEFCKAREKALNWENASFRNNYTQKVLSVRYNIKLRPDLLEKMKNGEHSIKGFVNAKPWEICPDKWTEAFDMAAKRTLRFSDASSVDPDTMPDGMLTCGKCKSKKTSYFEMQCRAADEPKRHGLKSIAPRTSGPCAWETRLDFQTSFTMYVSC
jgi:DNA-directed RNA polymerase subunit M/transcription elongation factor TFIIS